MKIKEKLLLFMLLLFAIIGLNAYTVYADEGNLSIYQYDYSTKQYSTVPYDNKAFISGLRSFNAVAVYSVDGVSDETVSYVWRVAPQSRNVITVTATGTTMYLGRAVGLRPGYGIIYVDAYKDGNIVATTSYTVMVSNSELSQTIFGDLYNDGTNYTLPSTTDILNNFNSVKSSHPRIMVNSEKMQLVDKYITYAHLLKKDSSEWDEYEKLVYDDINSNYNGKDTPGEYFDTLYNEYTNMYNEANSYLYKNTDYPYTLSDGSMVNNIKKLEAEIENVGFVWLLHNAHNQNIEAYKDQFTSQTEYENIKAAYNVNDYSQYAERVKTIMNQATSYSDWNTSHFLDTGMMSYAMGMAYDWIYDYLSAQDKVVYAYRIKELGVAEGNSYLRSVYSQQKFRSNWSAVNFSGISVASMAIFESYPDLCARQIADTARFLPVFLNQLSPDGALSESTGYWNLSMRYCSYLFSSLKYTFDNDFCMTNVKGFEESWYFPLYITGRDNTDSTKALTYNYGDASGGKMAQSAMIWFAEEKSDILSKESKSYLDQTNALMWYKIKHTDPYDYDTADIQDLLWYPLIMSRYNSGLVSTDKITDKMINNCGVSNLKFFGCQDDINNNMLRDNDLMSDSITFGRGEKVNLVTLSQSFIHNTSNYFATKGMNIKGSHRDLDMGSFIFDSLGVRWANELGKTTYAGDRYSYYVKRAEGHNTIVINPTSDVDQNINSTAKLSGDCEIKQEDCITGEKASIVKYDMSNAYNVTAGANPVRNNNSVKRGFMLFDNSSRLMIQDEISLDEPSDIYWFLQTLVRTEDYSISEDGKTVVMNKTDGNGNVVRLKAELKVTADNPLANARFSTMDYKCIDESLNEVDVNKSFYKSNSKYKKLAIHVSEADDGSIQKVSKAVITVILTPIFEDSDMNKGMGEIIPIDNWQMHSYFADSRQMSIDNNSMRLNNVGETVNNNVYINNIPISSDRLNITVDNPNVISVDASGIMKTSGYGDCNITISSKDYPELTKSFSVNVQNVTSVKFNKTNIEFGRLVSSTIKMTAYPTASTNREMIWESSDPKIATVDQNGKVSAVSNGECKIVSYWKYDTSKRSECTVKVRIPLGVSIDKASLTLSKLGSLTLSAWITNKDAKEQGIVWKSQNEKVAIVDKKGKVTALGNGVCKIVASSAVNSKLYAACQINVNAPTRVMLNKKSISFTKIMATNLKAKVYPANRSVGSVIWKSSNKKVATVDSNGVVKSKANGTCVITAVSILDNRIMDKCTVKVKLPKKVVKKTIKKKTK